MKIGEQLQRQRKLHQMSQNELADKLNISRQSISKWENGTTLPSFTNVIAISDLFDISLDELIRGDEDLMNKFEGNKSKFTNVEKIWTIGFILSIVLLFIIGFLGISTVQVEDLFSFLDIIFFVGLVMNINWKDFNRSLNKKAVIFGILLLVTLMVPELIQFVMDFLRESSNYHPYYY